MKCRKYSEKIKCLGELEHEDIIHNSVGFVVNNAIDKDKKNLYDATKGRWKCNIENVKNIELVFSLYRTMIVEIWIPGKWMKSDIEGRVQWEGIKCEDKDIRDKYLYKKVPKAYSAVRYYGNISNK